MLKTNRDKASLLKGLLCSTLDSIDGIPKGITLLGKAAAKQIPEETIDETLDMMLDFLARAYIAVEEIRHDGTPGEIALSPNAQADLNRSNVSLLT